MNLPKEVIKASTGSPRRLIFYSAPKTGKTKALSLLNVFGRTNLILDFEEGSDFVDAFKVKIIGIYTPEKEDALIKKKREDENKFYLDEVLLQLKKDGDPYYFISVDTTTGLEDMIVPIALKLFRNTPMGKGNTEVTDVRVLPNGAGWLYWRQAFDNVVELIQARCKVLILSGHIKEKIIEVGKKEVEAKALDLSGKLSSIVCSKGDAVAYMYRNNKNQVILNFKTSEQITCGARPEHLKNKEIVLTELDEQQQVVAHWDQIFID
jgi:hypothetical protein